VLQNTTNIPNSLNEAWRSQSRKEEPH